MTVGLVMLARDEAATLPVTIPHVREHIDHWTIVDTGSEDNTADIAAELLDGIPGQVHRRDWRGFAHNRTEALSIAKGTCDYHLILDADLIVHADQPIRTMPLHADAYMIQFAGGFQMSLPLLLRDGHDWQYKGAAHSYLDAPDNTRYAHLAGVTLHETRTSSPRADKIAEDARLLEQEISPRTLFYLAQSYRDLGHARAAADLYRLRIRHSAENPQEVFWACYQEALLRLETDGLEAATPVFLEAWQRRPSRAEPLWKLAREYRLAGQPHVGMLFATPAADLPMPDDHGFVLAWVYQWGALLERALCARQTGRPAQAIRDLTVLHSRPLDDEPAQFVAAQLAELTPIEEIAA